MKITKERVTDFLSGKGFYLVLAVCLIAVGVAAFAAYGGIDIKSDPVEEISSKSPMDTIFSSQTSSGFPAGTEASEPYSSEEELSSLVSLAPDTTAYSFSSPLSGEISKSFSGDELVYSATYKDMRLHSACDIVAEEGRSVFSCGNGLVTAVFTDSELGLCVEIDHGNGIVAYYCGLKETLLVSEGSAVNSKTVIGHIGEVPGECEDGFHLHLEFYKNGEVCDPMNFIG